MVHPTSSLVSNYTPLWVWMRNISITSVLLCVYMCIVFSSLYINKYILGQGRGCGRVPRYVWNASFGVLVICIILMLFAIDRTNLIVLRILFMQVSICLFFNNSYLITFVMHAVCLKYELISIEHWIVCQ